jgi:hypothetical protein
MIMVIGPHKKKTEARADRAAGGQGTSGRQVPSPRGAAAPDGEPAEAEATTA